MDNNLDNFFSKKLNDMSSSNDGWDEPSESVWQNAQPNFPTYQKSKWNWLAILVILLGLGLVGTSAYLLKTQKSNHALEQEIAGLKTQLNKEQSSKILLQNQNATLQKQLEKEQIATSETVKNLEKNCAISLKNAIQNNTIQYQKKIQEQYQTSQNYQQETRQLRQANEALKNENRKIKSELLIAKAINKKIDEKLTPINELEEKPIFAEKTTPEIINLPNASQPKKTWKKFEIGVDLSSIGFNMELANTLETADDFQGQGTTTQTFSAETTSSSSYYIADATAVGFHVAYAPKENFYIRTGLRYANFYVNNTSISGIIYDESNEYVNAQGKVVNDLLLNSNAPYNNVTQAVTVEIPNGSTIETGDILFSTLTNYQDYNFYQVPLGVAYYRGKRRWQWEFQGGLTWNHIVFGDYDFSATFKTDNIDIPIDGYDVLEKSKLSKSYLGAYLGIGANYRISDKWQIRAGLTFEETGLRTNIQRFPRRYLIDSEMNLSLNYRF